MSKRVLLLLAMIASVFSLFSEVEAASSDVKVGLSFCMMKMRLMT